MMDLSVVIPCYQEAENLEILLPDLKRVCAGLADRYEIVVVDTMEPMDGTPEVCRKFEVEYRNREGGNRYGDAVRTGIREGNGEYLVIMDADNSHSPEFIKQMYSHREEADVIIASRYIKGGETEVDQRLTFMSLALNSIYSFVLGIDCKDMSNSYRLYKNNILKSIKVHCNNFDVVEEILYKLKCKHKNLRILEMPYNFKKRMHGYTKRKYLSFLFTYVVSLFRLRMSKYKD